MPFLSSKWRKLASCAAEERGSSVIETALLAPVFLFALVAAVDYGQAYYTSNQVAFSAHAAALYGIQYPTDISGISAAAVAGAGAVPNMTVSVKTGCECFDGTGASENCAYVPSCSMNIVDYVDVQTQATYLSILPYPGVPSSIVLNGRSRLRVAHSGGSL